MLITRWINTYERGLLFRNGEFVRMIGPGRVRILDPLRRMKLEIVSVRAALLEHRDLEVITRSGALAGEAEVLDLKDSQRALIWIDERFLAILGPGVHALWTVFHKVRVEIVDTDAIQLERKDLALILNAAGSGRYLEFIRVEPEQLARVTLDGKFHALLGEGLYGFWKTGCKLATTMIDLRRTMLDITGQELMTADRVTLRLNALATIRVKDAQRFAMVADDPRQQLYREAQLALRSAVGTRTLDDLLADKTGVVEDLEGFLRKRAEELGLEVLGLGIRDIILPGEMRELLNRVTEARKAAEAAFISRREETAAVRSQANTARLFESNPTLMKLRELEVLEKVADKADLKVVLGEKGLASQVINML